jgi:hypothetical protein
MFTPVEQQDDHEQSEQQQPRQEQKRAQSPQQRAIAAAAAAAGKLLPIAYADGRVTVGDGTVLLDSMSTQVRVNNPAATDMVLLSLAASNGATSMEDFALGAVSAPIPRCAGWLLHCWCLLHEVQLLAAKHRCCCCCCC